MTAAYAPWRRNQYQGWVAFLLTIGIVALIAFELLSWKIGVPLAVVLYAFAEIQLRRARKRAFGKTIEHRAMPGAVQALRARGFEVNSNVRMASGADIDFVAQKGARAVTIEIKAFVKWNRFLFFWNGRREAHAVRQACAQMKEVGATTALVWLPQGRLGFTHWGRFPRVGWGVRLVAGGAGDLADAVEAFLR